MKMTLPRQTRRHFLAVAGTTTTAAVATPIFNLRGARTLESPALSHGSITDPAIKELVKRGIDAATNAGASYADVRFTHNRERNVGSMFGFDERENQTIGVRVLVDGYWGFAADATCHPDAVVRLAREAVALAKVSGLGEKRTIDLAPVSVFTDEHWSTPIEVDPFEVPISELVDFHHGMIRYCRGRVQRLSNQYRELKLDGTIISSMQFSKQLKAFGSSDGSYGTQSLFQAEGTFRIGGTGFGFSPVSIGPRGPEFRLDYLSPTGAGLELFTKTSMADRIDEALEKWIADLKLPRIPVDVGRYEMVIDAESMAGLASGTLGAATELDRASGYEANTGGTSYLNDPSEMINTYRVGAQSLTVRADRTTPGGAATSGWDDEGVKSSEATLIDRGILQRFQTTRESATWLASDPRQSASTGCAIAQSGGALPVTQSANLRIEPDDNGSTYASMVEGMERGIVFENMTVQMDFQQLNGVGWGRAYEIRGGKRTAMLVGAAILFRAPELWKSITAIGGAASRRRFGKNLIKGMPAQSAVHSITTPAVAFKDMTVVDILRK